MEKFSERLAKALETRHMTAAELSKITGIADGTISNYKKGRYEPKQRILNKIASALDVSIAYLMGDDVDIGRYEIRENFGNDTNGLYRSEIVLDLIESEIINTYRKADGKQKISIITFVSDIAKDIEKNNSGNGQAV